MNYSIIGVVSVVVVAVGGWWWFGHTSGDAARTTEPPMVSMREEEAVDTLSPVRGKGSLLSLSTLGQSLECSFMVRVEGMTQTGTAFYDAGLARVDTLVSGAGTPAPVASYLIIDTNEQVMYVWGTMADGQGVKMSLTSALGSSVAGTSSSQADVTADGVMPDTDVEYDCTPWSVDGSVFVPPADITFTDMTQMLQMMEGIDYEAGMPTPVW